MIDRIRFERRGFTLLELLVALAVAALAIGACLDVFGTAADRLEWREHERVALAFAQSKLAEIGTSEPAEIGESLRDLPGNYRLKVVVRPFLTDATEALPVVARQVDVRAWWQGPRGRAVEVSLSTVRLVPRE